MDARMRLIIQVASLSCVIQAWVMFMHQRVVRRAGRPLIHYGPLFPREQERIQNLNYIYNCNDVEALWMLRMKKAPFARLVETFRTRGLLQDNINTSVESKWPCFSMLLAITRGSGSFTTRSGDQWRPSLGNSSRCFLLLGSLEER